jgi:hypothetical protein
MLIRISEFRIPWAVLQVAARPILVRVYDTVAQLEVPEQCSVCCVLYESVAESLEIGQPVQLLKGRRFVREVGCGWAGIYTWSSCAINTAWSRWMFTHFTQIPYSYCLRDCYLFFAVIESSPSHHVRWHGSERSGVQVYELHALTLSEPT